MRVLFILFNSTIECPNATVFIMTCTRNLESILIEFMILLNHALYVLTRFLALVIRLMGEFYSVC